MPYAPIFLSRTRVSSLSYPGVWDDEGVRFAKLTLTTHRLPGLIATGAALVALSACSSSSLPTLSGFDAVCDYLSASGYGAAADALRESPSAFECWCDNYLIDMIRPQKYNAFSVGPLVAYVLARENEIKTVGIILSGKENGLSDDSIRERIREMYV